MRHTITISLPDDLKRALDDITAEERVSRSDIVRASLQDYIFLRRFRALRRRMSAKARAAGVYTDEDVFQRVS
ncbi:MAG: ribbon-helix-helix domain-containing protein [Candidatus Acidiferrales bacterium]